MSDSRSRRTSKKVNYAAFGGEDDDDDDFKDCTPPPTKKQKTSQKHEKQKTKTSDLSKKSRKTPVDRSYERDLQAALEMSMQEVQSMQEQQEDETGVSLNISDMVKEMEKRRDEDVAAMMTTPEETSYQDPKQDVDSPVQAENNEDEHPPVLQPIVTVTSNLTTEQGTEVIKTLSPSPDKPVTGKKRAATNVKKKQDDIDVIEQLPSSPEKMVTGKRRAATKARKSVVVDEDSDFEDDSFEASSENSDDDYDEENDSEFEEFIGKKKKKTPAKKGKGQEKLAKKTESKSKLPVTKTENKSKIGGVKKGIKPSTESKIAVVPKTPITIPNRGPVSSGRSPAGIPKWNPPGIASSAKSPLGGVSIKSPSTGCIRVGLSRNQHVKSLHSGLNKR